MDKQIRYVWSIFASCTFAIAMFYMLNSFFNVVVIISLLMAVGMGAALLALDISILRNRFRHGPKWTVGSIAAFVPRLSLMFLMLGLIAIFMSAARLDSSVSNYLADKELTYIESKKSDAGYQRFLKREIELVEDREDIKAELSAYEKEEVALEYGIDARREQLAAEAAGITYVVDGREIGSGDPNNLQNPAANKEWNKMNAIQQERNAELRGVMGHMDRLKSELRDINTELKDIKSQKDNFIANAELESGVRHKDLAINKVGALVDMVSQEGPQQVEAIMTTAFILIIVLFIDFVQIGLLYMNSTRGLP